MADLEYSLEQAVHGFVSISRGCACEVGSRINHISRLLMINFGLVLVTSLDEQLVWYSLKAHTFITVSPRERINTCVIFNF